MARKKKVSSGAIVATCLLAVIIGVIAGAAANVILSRPKSQILPLTKVTGAVTGEINVQSVLEEDLSIHFMMLGNKNNGDSIYIKAGDNDILVDAGSKTTSINTLKNYINQYCLDGKLEYVIATHADSDHISAFTSVSGCKGIFESYEVKTVIDFARTNKSLLTDKGNKTTYGKYVYYRDLENANHYTAYDCYYEQSGGQRVFQLTENIELEILYNYYYDHNSSDENNYSVCFMINQEVGEDVRHYFFTGDLEEDGEKEMVKYYKTGNNGSLPSEVELFKAGHHGSKTSSNLVLLNEIKPKICVVSCVAGSEEFTDVARNTFPTQDFLDNISTCTTRVYVTSMHSENENGYEPLNGNIVYCYSDREVIYCSNSSAVLKDSDWFIDAVENGLRDIPELWATHNE